MKTLPYTIEVLDNDFNVLERTLLFRCNTVWTVTTHNTVKLRSELHENAVSYFVLHYSLSLSILYCQMMT